MIVGNNTPGGDNNINDFNDDDNHDSDDDDNVNDDQAITIFHTMHFREPLISKKPRFLALNHV